MQNRTAPVDETVRDVSGNIYRTVKGLPGGNRSYYGTFVLIGNYGDWWSSTENITTYAWTRGLYYANYKVYRGGYGKNYGFSVRCVRD